MLRQRELDSIQKVLGRPPATAVSAGAETTNVPFILRPGDTIPLNEFTENNRILSQSFPFLFLLGPCPGLKLATMDPAWVQHANKQYSNKFAQSKDFQFLIFDQYQRHAAARLVSKKVKNNLTAMQDAAKMINCMEWQERLASAVANPDSKDAANIIKEVIG